MKQSIISRDILLFDSSEIPGYCLAFLKFDWDCCNFYPIFGAFETMVGDSLRFFQLVDHLIRVTHKLLNAIYENVRFTW